MQSSGSWAEAQGFSISPALHHAERKLVHTWQSRKEGHWSRLLPFSSLLWKIRSWQRPGLPIPNALTSPKGAVSFHICDYLFPVKSLPQNILWVYLYFHTVLGREQTPSSWPPALLTCCLVPRLPFGEPQDSIWAQKWAWSSLLSHQLLCVGPYLRLSSLLLTHPSSSFQIKFCNFTHPDTTIQIASCITLSWWAVKLPQIF